MWTSTSDTPSAFTVALCDYPGLPDSERSRAEARYARTLSQQLGGDEHVAEILRQVASWEEAAPEEVTDEVHTIYRRWTRAVQAAAQAGMQGLGEGEGCYFEVKPQH